MSALEQEIIEKFRQLQPDARQRVLQTLTSSFQTDFDEAAWWAEVQALQADMRARLGEVETTDALSLLDDLREESS